MNLFFELSKKPVFKIEDVDEYYHNINSARSAVRRLIKEGMAVKIRNNLYTCISGESGQPIANRFQIASNITPTSYISHHTAMEYYGIVDQVFYDVYVSSQTRFSDFEFGGYMYHYVPSDQSDGIDKPVFSGGIAVTTLERTLVDSIKDMDKIAGIEEIVNDIECVQAVQEKSLLRFLAYYQNQFLYQKVGFLLMDQKKRLELSDSFFDICKQHIGKSKRYLTNDMQGGKYNAEWGLVVPKQMHMKNGEVEDATI